MPIYGPNAAVEIQYMFIDGAYLSAIAKDVGEQWFGAPIDLDYAKLATGCTKTFYYDCLPPKADTEDETAYEARRSAKEALFNKLRAYKGWHVSEGLAKWRRKRGSQQKEVDILIAVDMLTHTHRRNMSRLIFLAGDQDFRPLVEAVVREGMYVTLWYERASTSQDLLHEADDIYRLGIYELHAYATDAFQAAHPVPSRSYNNLAYPMDSALVEVGNDAAGASVVRLYSSEGTWVAAGTSFEPPNQLYLHLRHADKDFLKRVWEDVKGPCTWAPA